MLSYSMSSKEQGLSWGVVAREPEGTWSDNPRSVVHSKVFGFYCM